MTGMFYYCLCNIDPSLRSRLQSIMLLAAVEISVMEKYGIDKVLEPFVEEMKQLESVRDTLISDLIILS